MRVIRTVTLLALSLAAVSCASSKMEEDEMITVKGSISYLEKIALGPEAVAHIRIVDLDLVDKPGYLVAQKAIHTPGQVPIEFELTYWEESVESGHHFALQARIQDSGKVIFSTPEDVEFDVKEPPRQELILKPAE